MIITPDVRSGRMSPEALEAYRREQLAKWPFSLSYEEAYRRLAERKKTLEIAAPAREPEPASYKRRIKKPRATMKAHASGKEQPSEP
jgi:hypothetical protein